MQQRDFFRSCYTLCCCSGNPASEYAIPRSAANSTSPRLRWHLAQRRAAADASRDDSIERLIHTVHYSAGTYLTISRLGNAVPGRPRSRPRLRRDHRDRPTSCTPCAQAARRLCTRPRRPPADKGRRDAHRRRRCSAPIREEAAAGLRRRVETVQVGRRRWHREQQ